MFLQLNLLALLLAPVMTYVGAAIVFSVFGSKAQRLLHPVSRTSLSYPDSQ
ncbi:hypothetical protein LJ739_14630 [Aestuariibacter halophilus]|uniref:Uncharacterized protein n=1 Tax=Fluctibacter halophilus TaxID=226011 RepID=A0ABS8GBB1_9ALTE|nr:hypothetical protein [Aestuariibacter halophilus]MCC2617486.1 hypothetical protein [Aestuariibacter halophilus]